MMTGGNSVLSGVETAAQQLADAMVPALPVTIACVAIWEQPSYSLRIKAVRATRPLPYPPGFGTRVSLAASPWHRAAMERREPILVEPRNDGTSLSPEEAGLMLIPDLRSLYLVPICVRGEVIGVLGLGEMRAPERERFDEAKRERCQTILNESLTASASAWETGWLRRQMRATSSLLGIIDRIHNVRSYEDVLACIAPEISDWLGTPVRGVLFHVRPSGTVELAARWPLSSEGDEVEGRQILTALARTGGTRGFPISVSNVADDPLDPFHMEGDGGRPWTRIALPLLRGGRLIGLACLYVEDELRPVDWELEAFRRRAELGAVGMALVEAQDEQRNDREWLGRAAWELLTGHQQTVLHEAAAGIGRLVSARLDEMKNQAVNGQKQVLPDVVVRELDHLLADVLAVTSPPAVSEAPIEINALVRRTLEIARARETVAAGRTGVTVRFQPTPEPLMVQASVGLIGAVLHAISNAMEAVADHGEIEVRTARDNGHVVVSVTDNGPGLPPTMGENAFAPFVTTKGASHLGLGLAIVRALAVRHGGDAVLSSGAAGTQLLLRLPAVDASQHALNGEGK
jgi:signal transduction histidine kinase